MANNFNIEYSTDDEGRQYSIDSRNGNRVYLAGDLDRQNFDPSMGRSGFNPNENKLTKDLNRSPSTRITTALGLYNSGIDPSMGRSDFNPNENKLTKDLNRSSSTRTTTALGLYNSGLDPSMGRSGADFDIKTDIKGDPNDYAFRTPPDREPKPDLGLEDQETPNERTIEDALSDAQDEIEDVRNFDFDIDGYLDDVRKTRPENEYKTKVDESLNKWGDISEGKGKVFDVLNRHIDRFDANAASQEQSISQRIANNPNMTEAAKHAAMMEGFRVSGINRSALLGDLAEQSQNIMVQALDKYTGVAMDMAQFEEQQFQNDFKNAFSLMTENFKQAYDTANLSLTEVSTLSTVALQEVQKNLAVVQTDNERFKLFDDMRESVIRELDAIITQPDGSRLPLEDTVEQMSPLLENLYDFEHGEGSWDELGSDGRKIWTENNFYNSAMTIAEEANQTLESTIRSNRPDWFDSNGDILPDYESEYNDYREDISFILEMDSLGGVERYIDPVDGKIKYRLADLEEGVEVGSINDVVPEIDDVIGDVEKALETPNEDGSFTYEGADYENKKKLLKAVSDSLSDGSETNISSEDIYDYLDNKLSKENTKENVVENFINDTWGENNPEAPSDVEVENYIDAFGEDALDKQKFTNITSLDFYDNFVLGKYSDVGTENISSFVEQYDMLPESFKDENDILEVIKKVDGINNNVIESMFGENTFHFDKDSYVNHFALSNVPIGTWITVDGVPLRIDSHKNNKTKVYSPIDNSNYLFRTKVDLDENINEIKDNTDSVEYWELFTRLDDKNQGVYIGEGGYDAYIEEKEKEDPAQRAIDLLEQQASNNVQKVS